MQNIHILIPVISKALGRDITNDVSLFFRARAAVGDSLNEEGQKVFAEHWPKLVDFMESQEGKQAISNFLDAWVISFQPKEVKAPEVPPSTPPVHL